MSDNVIPITRPQASVVTQPVKQETKFPTETINIPSKG